MDIEYKKKIAYLRCLTYSYVMGGLWASDKNEQVILDTITQNFEKYIFSKFEETPRDIVDEYSWVAKKLLENIKGGKDYVKFAEDMYMMD